MTVSALRQALTDHLGQTLTPEVAAAIESLALAGNRSPIDPKQFSAEQHGRYCFQVERFQDILAELHELHVMHWAETERYRHGIALNPNYLAMAELENAGRLIQFTIRDELDTLVGNLRMYLAESLHTQTRYASEDTLFIAPQARGGFTVMAFMRYAERVLRSLGIKEIRANSKLVNKADVLMRRMGYTPVSLEFVKFFED